MRSTVSATESAQTSDSCAAGASGRRTEHERDEERRAGLVLPAATVPAASGALVIGGRDGPFRRVRGEEELRRLALDLVDVRPPEPAAEQRLDPLAREARHSSDGVARFRFTAERLRFDARRRSRAAVVGRVGRRCRSTCKASASFATSRSTASSRFRAWLRSSWATARITGPAFARTRRLLPVRQRGRRLDVEEGLDARLRGVRVLAAGPRGAGEAELDLVRADRDGARDADGVPPVGHPRECMAPRARARLVRAGRRRAACSTCRPAPTLGNCRPWRASSSTSTGSCTSPARRSRARRTPSRAFAPPGTRCGS